EQLLSKQPASSPTSAAAELKPEVEVKEPEPKPDQPASTTKATETNPKVNQVIPIPAEDLAAIKDIFSVDTFFATETIPYQDGAIFRGNLRSAPDHAHGRLSDLLAEKLGDRYRLFLVEGQENKPVVIVLPGNSDLQSTTWAQKVLAVVLAIATVFTSLETAGILLGFDFYGNWNRLHDVLPVSLGILMILAVHELGHWLLANRHQVQISPPFWIPAWQIGSFGAITRFESLLSSRTILFDISFAGPAMGWVLSFGLLILGLLLSHQGSLFQVPAEFFRESILVGILAKVTLRSALQATLVDVHPLMVLGWLGLVINAINLMPAGQLDGGRIMQAIYGRKIAGRSTIVTLIVLALASLVNPLALYWGVLILILQRNLERPSLDDISAPNDTRAALGLLAFFLMLMTLLPLTPSLADRLGIGG
ncbi:MAG: site-2 protease family protein, partial [Cyanothece sp. SIO1E1]|nr:site-2 protease family protein [Cyanothece sp. SIO1E1]